MDRRYFLKGAAATSLLGVFPGRLAGLTRENAKPAQLEKRGLGQTGAMLSVIGFGGIVVRDATPEQATERVRTAIDRGVNYFDVAPAYGNAEEMLGPALAPFRKDVFLACKTKERSRAAALADLDRSLARLQTGHFDLYQLHAVKTAADLEQILAPGGALEAMAAARRSGRARFLGFSAHSVEAAQTLMDRFDFDTILFPVSYRSWEAGNFGPQVLEMAQKKKMGILALKALVKGPRPRGSGHDPRPKVWYEPFDDPAEAKLALRFTLAHPVTAAIPPGDENLFRMALDLALDLEPLSEAEALTLKRAALAGEPLFKRTSAS